MSDWKQVDLVIDDVYLEEMEKFFRNTSEKAEFQLDTLLKSLKELSETAVKEGSRAEALRAFTEQAAQLQSCIATYGRKTADLLEELNREIIKMDKLR